MYSSLTIVGNVGKDPEMRYTPSGQAVTSFSVATNNTYTTGGGEQVKETTWYRITAWGKLGETCNQYVKKGMKVLVEGRLTPDKSTGGPRIWTNNSGEAQASFEVNANVVRFLSSVKDSGGASDPLTEDELPF